MMIYSNFYIYTFSKMSYDISLLETFKYYHLMHLIKANLMSYYTHFYDHWMLRYSCFKIFYNNLKKWDDIVPLLNHFNLNQSDCLNSKRWDDRLLHSWSIGIFDRSNRPMILMVHVWSGYTNQNSWSKKPIDQLWNRLISSHF